MIDKKSTLYCRAASQSEHKAQHKSNFSIDIQLQTMFNHKSILRIIILGDACPSDQSVADFLEREKDALQGQNITIFQAPCHLLASVVLPSPPPNFVTTKVPFSFPHGINDAGTCS